MYPCHASIFIAQSKVELMGIGLITNMFLRLFAAVIFALFLGGLPSRRLETDRIRISILFCVGTLLFAQAIYLNHPLITFLEGSVGLAALFMLCALFARAIIDRETRPYSTLAAVSTCCGLLLAAGAALWAIWVATLYCAASLFLDRRPTRHWQWLNDAIQSVLPQARALMNQRRFSRGSSRSLQPALYITCATVFAGSFGIALFGLDERISNQLRSAMIAIVPEMRIATHLADASILIPFCILIAVLLFRRNRPYVLFPAMAILSWSFGEAATLLLKHMFGRPRPYLLTEHAAHAIGALQLHWIGGETGRGYLGFPSGHSTAFFAVAWVFVNLPNCKTRVKLGLLSAAILLSLGRVILDQHYIADIIASGAIGIVIAQVLMDWVAGRLAITNHRTS
jgi:membrane-associated phospholipid phosphatase